MYQTHKTKRRNTLMYLLLGVVGPTRLSSILLKQLIFIDKQPQIQTHYTFDKIVRQACPYPIQSRMVLKYG